MIYICLTRYSGYLIKNNEMGWECSMYEGKERCIQGFGRETRRKETTCKAQL